MARVAFTDFNKRLFVAGGRDQAPDGTLRRARGIAPELTDSVMSMYPPQVLYGIRALNLIRFDSQRFQFDGALLYKNGSSIASGFNGSRAAIVTMPPNIGLQDYLFIAGAGKNVKVSPAANTVQNWGINQPLDQMTAVPVAQDIITIDSFDSHAGNWTTHACAVANDNTEFQFGTGSMKITPSASPWFVNTTVGYPQNFAVFSNNDISLPSDLISIWVNLTNPLHTIWMWLMFDVNDGTFKKDYYLAVIQLVQSTTNSHAAGANATFIIDADRWMQVAVPKSSFQRIGTHLNLDWSNVVAARIEGGALTTAIPTPVIRVDQFQIIGGSPLGIGPQAISPEHGSAYNYYATFLNLVTGNRSNPQPDPTIIAGVALQNVSLANIPVSTDTQVGARELWRTSAILVEGTTPTAFFLDTIYDNTTTTYTDKVSDLPEPITQTPWQASSAYVSGQLVDAGNGYYFKASTGTTAATVPLWVVPQTTWAPLSTFLINETIAPRKAVAGHFFKVTVAGVSGRIEPNWAAGGTIIDGTVTWADQGTQTTTDGTVTWTFQGINDIQTLGTQAIQLDNIPPPATIGDAVGPYQGSMVWTRNSAVGSKGNVYISPPGRAEGYGVVLNVSTDNDPAQKLVIWQEQLWLLTTNAIYRMDGVYPNITPTKIYDNSGTIFPFTVASTKRAYYYRDQDAIKGMNYAANEIVGFDQLSPILRNQPAENLPAFKPTLAGFAREELYWSDETQVTLAMNLNPETGHAWRSFNVAMTAIYYEEETGEIVASWNGVTGLWEHPTFIITPGDNLLVTAVSVEVGMPNI